jgi:PAS domain S-box-containing protein
VTEADQVTSDVPLEASILDSAVPLESILRTEELYRRPSRPPDYEKENRALVALVSALADSPRSILQALAERVLEVLQADSAGLSLLTKDEKRFYWAAIAGAWQPHIGGGTPRDSGPCGDVLDRNMPMLFTHWERRYPYLDPATPLAEEGLLVPFYVNGKAVGTIWAIAHTNNRKFDAEDLRLLESLGRFASVAYQAVASIDALKFQIAEREKAETALQELTKGLEAKVRRLLEANIIGIVIWTLEGQIIEANEAFLRMVGYDREDLLSGRVSWRDLTPDDWQASNERALAELAATGVCEPFEKEFFRKDGSRVPILVGAALFEGSGNEGVAFVLDLTERKRAQQELLHDIAERKRVEHLISQVFECSPDAISIVGRDYRYQRVNPGYARIGRPAERMVGMHVADSVGMEAFERTVKSNLDRCFAGEEISYAEWFPTALGPRYLAVSYSPLRPDPERVDAVLAIIRDLTEPILASEALREAQADLAHVARVATLGEMSASIAHEVNQPLASVVTSTSACLRWLDAQKPEEARRSALRAIAEAHRASEIIGRIRSLAKKAPPQKDWLDVNETIHEVIALVRNEIQRDGVALETQLSDDVPIILADRVQLQQVILNLVMNAIEAMSGLSDGSRDLLVRSGTDESKQVVISVQDSGLGIDPENLDHLFDAFYTTKPQGLGMGLAISRSIIEAHGGQLWATANAPRGADFQFILPVTSE